MIRRLTLLLLVALGLVGSPALAQPEPTALRDEAREHFQKGVELFQEEAWEAALAEFLRSRELFATRAATKNAAVCSRTLHRFDEALDLYEILLRDFADLGAEDRATAERAVKDLRGLVGAVELTGPEPGATIVIDGRDRGVFPPSGPLRVSAGTHVVRIYKEGYAPFERRVDVAGGKSTRLDARLGALTRSGRLRVSERGGTRIDVLVDGVAVGKTPWEGPLAVGDHTIVLRGEGTLGTQPASAPVRANEVTPLTLAVEELSTVVRVQPIPAGASVAVDGVGVGRGIWEGRLRAGAHRIELASEGFLTATRAMHLARGQREVLAVSLERDPSSPLWKVAHPPALVFELDGAAALSPALGGEIEGGCQGDCSQSAPLGGVGTLHAGYRFGSGLGLGVTAGYAAIGRTIEDRTTRVQPLGLPANPGTATDSLALRGFLVGGSSSFDFGRRWPLLFRLSAGALFGSVRDERRGTFETVAHPGQRYDTGALSESQRAVYVALTPEIRFGLRVAERFVITAGVAGTILIGIDTPTWGDEKAIYSNDGQGGFGAQTLLGRTLLVVAPGLGLRYEAGL